MPKKRQLRGSCLCADDLSCAFVADADACRLSGVLVSEPGSSLCALCQPDLSTRHGGLWEGCSKCMLLIRRRNCCRACVISS